MGIIGIGVDIVIPSRVLRLYTMFGPRFLSRAFHPTEASRVLQLQPHQVCGYLSSRWAAKEALHKALGKKRLLFPDIEVFRKDEKGPPFFRLHNEAARYQREEGLELLLTLSHEEGMSVAFVVASSTMNQQVPS